MPKTPATPFALAERAIISLYDGGVLSPAVLERLLAVFAQANPDWEAEPGERSVDGRSLHEVVVLTMLPGESLRSPRKSFMAVIEHIASASTAKKPTRGASRVEEEEDEEPPAEDDDSAELARQLSGSPRSTSNKHNKHSKRGTPRGGTSKASDSEAPARPPTKTAAFNPLLNAAAPRKRKN